MRGKYGSQEEFSRVFTGHLKKHPFRFWLDLYHCCCAAKMLTQPGCAPLLLPWSLSDLRLTARFLPFLPAAVLPKYSRSPATLRFCRLASGKNHQKSPRSLKVRQTPCISEKSLRQIPKAGFLEAPYSNLNFGCRVSDKHFYSARPYSGSKIATAQTRITIL